MKYYMISIKSGAMMYVGADKQAAKIKVAEFNRKYGNNYKLQK